MITGFNTDIKHEGKTYHVQTEDKGLSSPLILSLVYVGGTILASKRSPYDDLLIGEFDEKALEERLNRQHKLMCAAIRAGRIDDLVRMTMKESAKKQKGLVAKKEIRKKVEEKAQNEEQKNFVKVSPEKIPDELKIPKPTNEPIEVTLKETVDSEIPMPNEDLVWDIPIIEDVQIVEDDLILEEEEIILPAEAVEIVSDLAEMEPLIDDELTIKILGDDKFNSGERKNINILVCRGTDENAITDANVMIKIIGSDFRPLIFHSKTDSNGVATIFLKLPNFRSGRAAVLVRAITGGEETELRRVIRQES